ncbi:flavin reductase family protein [Streptomyces lasalocidi]
MCGSARGGWPVCHRHITVITTTTGTGPEGFTCQSFTPLSLDPVPISFNVSRTSRTWPRIQEAETFCVNLLAAHQEPVARAFATQGTARFDGVDYTCEDGNGAPRPAEAAAWPDATIEDTHGGGDHLIVIGRVTAALTSGNENVLLFHQGVYAKPEVPVGPHQLPGPPARRGSLRLGVLGRTGGLLGPGTAVYRGASRYAAVARISTRSPGLARPLTPMIVQVG